MRKKLVGKQSNCIILSLAISQILTSHKNATSNAVGPADCYHFGSQVKKILYLNDNMTLTPFPIGPCHFPDFDSLTKKCYPNPFFY